MFYVIYKWKVKLGREDDFQRAWAEATMLIKFHRGGLGSRLHRCEDGTWLGYAHWPDRRTWENASSILLPTGSALAVMEECSELIDSPLTMVMHKDLLF